MGVGPSDGARDRDGLGLGVGLRLGLELAFANTWTFRILMKHAASPD